MSYTRYVVPPAFNTFKMTWVAGLGGAERRGVVVAGRARAVVRPHPVVGGAEYLIGGKEGVLIRPP